MIHHVRVHADTAEAIKAAADAAGAHAYGTWAYQGRYVGIIYCVSLGQRQHIRHNHPDVHLFPAAHSTADVSHHANKLGINAKTARDIHAAVFSELDLDVFDPDL